MDSAAGTAKQGRYREFQAILPLKGKVQNTEKSDFERMIKSPAIKDIIAAIGAGVGKTFDIDRVRYEKVIIMCFTGDTKVKLLNGTTPTFEELVEMERQNPGQDYWVYSRDKDGNIVPGRGFNPRITQYVDKIAIVTLDNGSQIKCTIDHRFMNRDGKYVEAQDLKPGDSLMSLYTRINDNVAYNHKREQFYNSITNKWEFTHHMVLDYFEPKEDPTGYHRHHKDFDYLNNDPKNLKWMEVTKYKRMHNKITTTKYNKSTIKRMRNTQLHSSIPDYFDSYEDAYESGKNYNHKVKSVEVIELDGYIAMYDFTVEEHHNFALPLDGGQQIIVSQCDADTDGNHIKALLLTLFYNYMSDLIKEGRVYTTLPPLYRIVMGKDNFYLKDDHELKEFRKKHKNRNYEVQRFKGLGEMDYDQLKETTMDPKTRILKQITMSDIDKAADIFETWMGKNAQLRRDFIEANADSVNLDFIE